MAKMPGAIWRPLAANWASQPRMRAYDFFCLHTMVGGLSGTDDFFRNRNGVGYGGTESHFGVGADGTIYQWQDTDFQADANADGNWHVISSENADTGAPFPSWGGSDVPAMTPQQVEANARIAAWLWNTHRIPVQLAPNSKPGSRGLAVHRYGVPGYMPAGAERWSTSQGKACPGDRRIAQAPLVSARAMQILNGDEDDMPTAAEVADEILNRAFPRIGPSGGQDGPEISLKGFLQWSDVLFLGVPPRVIGPLQGQIAGLAEAIKQLAAKTGQDIDLEAIKAAAEAGGEEGARRALTEGVDVDITVGGQPAAT